MNLVGPISKGGKVLWTCPECGTPVQKVVTFGAQFSYHGECGHWGPWKDRIKTSLQRTPQPKESQ